MEIINFLKDYGQYIAMAIIFIFEFVLLIIKRRPLTIYSFQEILSKAVRNVPAMISRIEYKVGSGQGGLKRSVVLTTSIDYIEKLLGRSLTELEYKRCAEALSTQIEDVLYAPTKKGGIGREEDV